MFPSLFFVKTTFTVLNNRVQSFSAWSNPTNSPTWYGKVFLATCVPPLSIVCTSGYKIVFWTIYIISSFNIPQRNIVLGWLPKTLCLLKLATLKNNKRKVEGDLKKPWNLEKSCAIACADGCISFSFFRLHDNNNGNNNGFLNVHESLACNYCSPDCSFVLFM